MARRLLGLLLVLGLSAPAAHAELSVVLDGDGKYRGTLLMFRTEQGIPKIWKQYRDIEPSLVLNPDGDRHFDAEPVIAVNPVTRLPEVVWSLRDGTDFEIAYGMFDGDRWTSPFLEPGAEPEGTLPRDDIPRLTTNVDNDLDPRLAIDARGVAQIVWWRDELLVDAVLYSYVDSFDADTTEPVKISRVARNSQYPDIIWFDGMTHIAYEEVPLVGFREVIVLGRQSDLEPFGYQHLDFTLMTLPVVVDFGVDPAGALFLSWTHAIDVAGVSYYEFDRWSEPLYLPR